MRGFTHSNFNTHGHFIEQSWEISGFSERNERKMAKETTNEYGKDGIDRRKVNLGREGRAPTLRERLEQNPALRQAREQANAQRLGAYQSGASRIDPKEPGENQINSEQYGSDSASQTTPHLQLDSGSASNRTQPHRQMPGGVTQTAQHSPSGVSGASNRTPPHRQMPGGATQTAHHSQSGSVDTSQTAQHSPSGLSGATQTPPQPQHQPGSPIARQTPLTRSTKNVSAAYVQTTRPLGKAPPKTANQQEGTVVGKWPVDHGPVDHRPVDHDEAVSRSEQYVTSRQQAEQTQQTVESARQQAEQTQQTVESARKQAEQTRHAARSAQQQAEQTRHAAGPAQRKTPSEQSTAVYQQKAPSEETTAGHQQATSEESAAVYQQATYASAAANQLASELADVLESETLLYKDASEISMKKTEVIVKGKIEELESLVKAEQAIILKIGKLEDHREEIISKLSLELDLDLKGLNLSQINDKLGESNSARLQACQGELINTLSGLKNKNETNEQLIQNALDYINFSVNLITTDNSGGINYSPDGEEDSIAGRKNIFDVKL